jgi:DNA-binding CsgD family transcriptional regulator
VLAAEGRPGDAAAALRRAWRLWHELEVPYEEARTRVLLAVACRGLGDATTADLELEAACAVLRRLQAAPALAWATATAGGRSAGSGFATGAGAGAGPGHVVGPPAQAGPPGEPTLTSRESEVLALVAEGRSNREIAAALVLSEHTVRRHLHNIFTKLDVSSRAAATAYAVRAGLDGAARADDAVPSGAAGRDRRWPGRSMPPA